MPRARTLTRIRVLIPGHKSPTVSDIDYIWVEISRTCSSQLIHFVIQSCQTLHAKVVLIKTSFPWYTVIWEIKKKEEKKMKPFPRSLVNIPLKSTSIMHLHFSFEWNSVIRYDWGNPWWNGTTKLVFEPSLCLYLKKRKIKARTHSLTKKLSLAFADRLRFALLANLGWIVKHIFFFCVPFPLPSNHFSFLCLYGISLAH